METSLWKLGNPLLAVSPWSSSTWFLALAPLGHGLQVLSMIGLLIASTQLWTTDTDGTPQKQIAVAPSYVRWSAVTIVRLSLHVVLESWLVYRHSRRYRPQPWLLARDVEEAVGDGRMDGVEMAMDFLRPRRNPGEEERAPTPHPDPSPSYAVPPGEAGPATEGRGAQDDTDDREKALQQLHDALERLALEEQQDKADGRDMREERQELGERLDQLAEQIGKLEDQLAKVDKPDESSGSRRMSADVPVLSQNAASACHSRSTSRSSHRSKSHRSLPDSPKLDPVAAAEAILADPPAQIAAFTAPSLAEAAKRRAERLQRYDRAASNLDLWVCAFGFIMWIVGMTVAFPAQPVKSLAPLVFAATMVGMVSNWFTALGFAACFLLWSLGYLLVIIAWLLWHLGILRGAQPALFPRTTAKKLAKEELDKCPLVIYAADPGEDTPEWEDLPGRPLSLSEINRERLPHPLRVLGANKATCGICHAEFLPPCTVEGKDEYELEVLRELPCLHTFHRECVDEWLLNHADTCPYCTQSVPDMLKDPAKAKVASQSAGAAEGASRASGELEELRRTMSRRRSQRSVRTVRSARSNASLASAHSATSAHPAKSSKTVKSAATVRQESTAAEAGKTAGKTADTASISSAGSDEFHDSREMPTPAPQSRAPSRTTLSTGYETASSSLGLASMRTATPMSRADTPIARTETPGPAARGVDGGKGKERGEIQKAMH